MANTASIIDMRGTPYQPCWGCGQLAGGHESHIYYGNFPFGVEHMDCGQRIKIILDRSLRALSTLNNDGQIQEIVTQTLITTSACKLESHTLNKIQDDHKIRSVVETEGMKAALATFRAIAKLDDITWETRLKAHSMVLQGPKLIEEKLSSKDQAELYEFLKLGLENKKRRDNECLVALERMNTQLKHFSMDLQNQRNITPYCILKDVAHPYYRNSDGMNSLQKLLKEIETKGVWRVLFLAKEFQDPTHTYITHVIVSHIALLPAEILIVKAKNAWQKTCGYQKEAVVLPLDCLEWKNHWVLMHEIGTRLSLGEGSKKRPLDF